MKHFGLYQADRRNDRDDGAVFLATALWQFVISLHVSKGLPIAAALQTAEANPDLVEEWGRRNGVAQPRRTGRTDPKANGSTAW